MLFQIQRSWVSSLMGSHVLLAMLKNNNIQTNNKYIQIENCLKKKSGYRNEPKIFCSDMKKDKKQLKSNVEMLNLTNFKESIREFSSWANKKSIDELYEKLKRLDSKLVLTNLSTYKDKWNKSDSEGAIMKVYNSFSYTEDVRYEARLLELPMQDNDFKLILIVPNETDVLSNLFKILSIEGLTSATDSIQPLFTSISVLKAPNIRFESEVDVTQQFFGHDFCLTTAELGNVVIDEQGVSINVLTCISPSEIRTEDKHANCDISKNPFYFSLIFQDMTIFNGQYFDVRK